MKIQKRPYRIGDWVIIRRTKGSFSLPAELPEGVAVRIVGLEINHDDVEYNGTYFRVPSNNVDSGWECEMNN